MAVIAMWKCDRDDTMYENRKDADAHDKMLELAESFSMFLEKHIEGISEKDSEALGILLSENKNQLVAACKGKPDLLMTLGEGEGEGEGEDEHQEPSNITSLAAKG